MTLGNALRRVLLSSLDGAAITSMRVTDVPHEFSDIPGVQEDMIQVLLQMKQLRLMLHDGIQPTCTWMCGVRAWSPLPTSHARPRWRSSTPTCICLRLTIDKAKLEIDMTVERGRGYSPAEERSGRLPIGELPVDAIFSPVKRVNWTWQRPASGRAPTSTGW